MRLKRRGRKFVRRRCGIGDRGAAGFRTDQAERGRRGLRATTEGTETDGLPSLPRRSEASPDGEISFGSCMGARREPRPRSPCRRAAPVPCSSAGSAEPTDKPEEARMRPVNAAKISSEVQHPRSTANLLDAEDELAGRRTEPFGTQPAAMGSAPRPRPQSRAGSIDEIVAWRRTRGEQYEAPHFDASQRYSDQRI